MQCFLWIQFHFCECSSACASQVCIWSTICAAYYNKCNGLSRPLLATAVFFFISCTCQRKLHTAANQVLQPHNPTRGPSTLFMKGVESVWYQKAFLLSCRANIFECTLYVLGDQQANSAFATPLLPNSFCRSYRGKSVLWKPARWRNINEREKLLSTRL